MALIEKQSIIAEVCPPINQLLCEQLLDEFVSAERRFIQQDWEPSQLDGGQFAEIMARIIYHIDSGNLNLSKGFDECIKYVENESVSHSISPRHNSIHLTKVLRTVYKFRSQRGAVHIFPTYKPNHMDSKLVIECVRWTMYELLRLFWQGDKESVAKAIRELLQFDVPSVGVYEDLLIVQRTDLTAEEEILILMFFGGELGLSRSKIGKSVQFSAPTATRTIQKLSGPAVRQVIQLKSGNYRLTDLGIKRVREDLAKKLAL